MIFHLFHSSVVVNNFFSEEFKNQNYLIKGRERKERKAKKERKLTLASIIYKDLFKRMLSFYPHISSVE